MTYTILCYNRTQAALYPPFHIKIFSKLFDMDTKNILIPPDILTHTPKQVPQKAKITKLEELDLDLELLEQYQAAKSVLEDIQYDEQVPANQKAQVMNTITSILQAIIKLQQDLHNVERMKAVENTLINVLQRHETLRDEFLKDYESSLAKHL